jgi:hypothetical protein
MKCNSKCIFYVPDIYSRLSKLRIGPIDYDKNHNGYVPIPGCRLDGKIVIGSKIYEETFGYRYLYDVPILTEDCVVPKKRIATLREMLGVE